MWKLRGTISTFSEIKCIWQAIWKTLKWEFLLPVTQIIISKKLFYCTKVGNILLKAIESRSRKKGMFPMKLLKPCCALFETFCTMQQLKEQSRMDNSERYEQHLAQETEREQTKPKTPHRKIKRWAPRTHKKIRSDFNRLWKREDPNKPTENISVTF